MAYPRNYAMEPTTDLDDGINQQEKKDIYAVDKPYPDNISKGSVKSGDDIVIQTDNRQKFTNKIDFLLACTGFSVGLGNVWRFPYLCYKNGGATFLIPYFISVLIAGVSIFTLEVLIGQFMSKGGIQAWNICPLFKGIGIGTVIVVFFLNCYYNVIMAWGFRYLFSSMQWPVPWASCGNKWNTMFCVDSTKNKTKFPASFLPVDPTVEYWEREVLGLTDKIEDAGTIKWDLALCLLLAWTLVFFCVFKGVKMSGKVLYVTATSPYILMIILLIRAATLNGAKQGILYFLEPRDLYKLGNFEVWVDAGSQVFFSCSLALGTLPALGSFNKFRHNCMRDAAIFVGINSFTSILAGLIIFMTLGYMSEVASIPISKIATAGPGLAFVVYPRALATLPGSTAWAILFFITFILLGLDSQFVGVEGLVSSVTDLIPKLHKRKYGMEIFTLCACILMYFVGLCMVTNGGVYVFQIFDHYSASKIVILLSMLECMIVMYVYGASRFRDNIKTMVGINLGYAPHIIWGFITPAYLLAIFVMAFFQYSELTYTRVSTGKTYTFPNWAIGFGWTMAMLPFVTIPIYMIYIVAVTPGDCHTKWRESIRPRLTFRHQLRPQDSEKDLSNECIEREKEEAQEKYEGKNKETYETENFTAF